ncbi:flagellar biosynthesis regulator FlaF [Roseinatronobacter monicus]|uniref:flagellar biosynthesis regulator FlaF n=1 Tax=Roseinatronobacter monicus TaxID=393481 RepID=UPI003F2A71E1
MNAHTLANAAYGQPNTAQKTPRSAEYDVIARITSRLRTAVESSPQNFAHVAQAMYENRRLWTELASDLSGSGNGLPDTLRLQLLQLAAFTLRHTDEVLAGRAEAAVLVDVNLAIMRGLSGKVDMT